MACSIDACVGRFVARGWCSKHYTRGSEHHAARLDAAKAAEIRLRIAAAPSTPYAAIAADFGVSKTTIWRVVNGLSWTDQEGTAA